MGLDVLSAATSFSHACLGAAAPQSSCVPVVSSGGVADVCTQRVHEPGDESEMAWLTAHSPGRQHGGARACRGVEVWEIDLPSRSHG